MKVGDRVQKSKGGATDTVPVGTFGTIVASYACDKWVGMAAALYQVPLIKLDEVHERIREEVNVKFDGFFESYYHPSSLEIVAPGEVVVD